MLKKKLIIILLFALIISGCKEQKENALLQTEIDVSTNKDTKNNSEDVLTLSMHPIQEFNPLKNKDATVDNVLRLIFEPLILIEDNNKIKNNLIEEINFSGDTKNSKANIKLRENIFWSDKTNLSSDDVIFSLDQIKSAPDDSIYKNNIDNIISYKKIDNYNLEINFKNGVYISYYLLDFPVIQKKFFSHNYSIEDINNFVCDGKYKITSYTRMKDLILEINDDDDAKSKIKKIKILITSDDETDVCAFNQKLIDVILTDGNDLGKFHSELEIIVRDSNNFEFIFLNPDLANIFRKVLVNVLPIDDIKQKIYTYNSNDFFIKNNFAKIDQERAKKILSEYKDIHELKIIVNQENLNRIKTANLIQKKLEEYEINSIVEQKNFSDYLKAIKNKNYDILIGGFALPNEPNCEKIFGNDNFFGYNNYNLIEALEKIRSAVDADEFKKAIDNFNKLLNDDFTFVSLGFTKRMFLLNKNINQEDILNIINYFN
jgi:peptide/nickel transport system substrate-binding protein